MSEVWLPVVGYEGLYEVSNQGRVRSLDRVVTKSNSRQQVVFGRILKPKQHNGYRHVDLSANGKVRRFRIHQLVCPAFNGGPPNSEERQEIRHLNGIKLDNTPENLCWGSSSENKFDSVRHGVHYPTREEFCKYGHSFDAENTKITILEDGRQRRTCLKCRYRRHREWKDKIRSPNYQRRDEICKRGHKRTRENTLVSNGRRRCRDCSREYLLEYRRAKANGEQYQRQVPKRYGAVNVA